MDEPTIYDNTPNTSDGRIATEMPWDSFLSRETRSEQQHTGEYVGSRETLNATARFAELSRLLVPLMDRFGRVLTDTAAHLDIEYDPLQAVAAESINESTDQLSSLQPGEIDSSILEARHPVAVDAEPPNPSSVQIRHMNGAASRQNLERVEPTSTPDAGLASLLASNLPPSLRQLLQPR